jgi:phage tail-like protein
MAPSDQRINVTPGFRFVVSIDGTSMAAFTECTLPVIEWNLEEVKEGGLNAYTHQLPGSRKNAKIILKNGVGVAKSLLEWITQSLDQQIVRKSISVTLLNSKLEAVQTIDIKDAYPIKWTGPLLKSDDNTIAIQTIEFYCGEIAFS